MKYSHFPGHFGTLTSWSVFRSALVNDFISYNDNIGMDIGSYCGPAALYKIKIGPLRPQIYLILSPGPRLFSFET